MQDSPSLRERQRLDNLRHLHEAALALATEQGLSEATVDAIAAAAGVSRRTFFNYYATKEDAILGITAPSVPAQALDAFLNNTADDALTRTVGLVAAIITTMRQSGGPISTGNRITEAFPELRPRIHHHVTNAQELALSVLEKHFEDGDEKTANKARVFALLASAAIRLAFHHDPAALENPSSPALRNAIANLRDALKED